MPIVLFIDTETNQYYIHLKGLAKINVEPHEQEIIRIKLKIAFMNFYFFPIDTIIKQKKTKKIKPENHKVKARKRQSITKGLKILKTLKVKQFSLDMDTGSVITNAKFFPAFAFLNYFKGDFNINFIGRNRLVLHLQDRPIDILKVFLNP